MKIREREKNLVGQFNNNKLKFHESTYHYSSEEKENDFVKSQFKTSEEFIKYQEYRKEWHRRADKIDSGVVPLAVICELVSTCDLKCEMCYTNTPEFQDAIIGAQRVLPWDTVVSVIDECVEIGVYSILFSWRGESTLYRSKGSDGKFHDFADVLDYARTRGILEVTSLTNGRNLSGKLIEKIVLAQPNWISFSVDGMDEGYGKIRKSLKAEEAEDPFQVVVSNIKKMIEIRDTLGFTRPQIRTNTIFPPISNDPERYKTFMEEIGVGLVTVNELLDFRGAELPEEAISDNWFCQYPFQRLVISANSIIMPCPGAHNEEDELVLGRYMGASSKQIVKNGKTKTTNYAEISLKQAWGSQKLKKIHKLHRENRRKEILSCKHCRHGAVTHGVDWIPEDWDMERMEWRGRMWRE